MYVNAMQVPSSYISRDEEVSELVLVMADVSTNLVMLTGKQDFVTRSGMPGTVVLQLVWWHVPGLHACMRCLCACFFALDSVMWHGL